MCFSIRANDKSVQSAINTSSESSKSYSTSASSSRSAEYFPRNRHCERVRDLVACSKRRRNDQAAVADRMGIDPSGAAKLETGYRELLQSTIQRCALAIGVVIVHQVQDFGEVDTGASQPSSSQLGQPTEHQ